MTRTRLDRLLVARGLVQSRARAADLVERGAVTIGGEVARKPGVMVDPAAALGVDAAANAWVARSGAKLAAGLAHFGFAVAGRAALDIGASTGGFSQVLVEAGARRVYAVEVGHGQLHPAIAADPRVVSLEGTDARALDVALVPEPVQAIAADVSFISLTLALPAALALAEPGAWLLALVKPQFEAGRAAVGKRGVVKDEAARTAAVEEVGGWLAKAGWRLRGSLVSPLPGKAGNIEYIIGAVRP